MRRCVLLLAGIFFFSACVSTKTFENLKAENEILTKRVAGLETDRSFLLRHMGYVYDRQGFALDNLKFICGELRKISRHLRALSSQAGSFQVHFFELESGIESAQKNLKDLEVKVNKLHKIKPDGEIIIVPRKKK